MIKYREYKNKIYISMKEAVTIRRGTERYTELNRNGRRSMTPRPAVFATS